MEETIIAACYERFSDDQKQDKDSIEGQHRECTRAIQEKGWILNPICVYSDSGISGAAVMTRPGLLSLLAAAKKKPCQFQYIVIDDTSRLNRNLGDILKIAEELNFRGVFLYFVAQKLDSRNYDTFRQMLIMYGMVDEQFLAKLGHSVHRGMELKVKNGMSAGGICHYGYCTELIEDPTKVDMYGRPWVNGVRIHVSEPEAIVVRRIFVLSGEGLSLKKIAKLFNDEGILPPASRGATAWSQGHVHTILRNNRYIGKVVWNRTKHVKDPSTGIGQPQPRPEEEWLQCELPQFRIISDEDWQRVRARFQMLSRNFGNDASPDSKCRTSQLGGLSRAEASQFNLFSGLLDCGICHGPIVTIAGSRYGCRNHRFPKRGKPCSNGLTIQRSALQGQLFASILDRLSQPEMLDHTITACHQQLQGDLARNLEETERTRAGIPKLKKQCLQLENEETNLLKQMRKCNDDDIADTLMSELKRIKAEEKAIKGLLDAPRLTLREIPLDKVRKIIEERAKDLKEILLGDSAAAQLAMRTYIGHLVLTPKQEEDWEYVVKGGIQLFSESNDVTLFRREHRSEQRYTQFVIPLSLVLIGRGSRKPVDYLAHPKCPASKVVHLWQKGESLKQIATELNLSTTLVSNVFHAVQAAQASCGNPLTRPDPSPERWQHLREDYLAHPKCPASEVERLRTEGKSFAEIGHSFDVSAPTAARVFYAVRPKAPRGHQRTDYLAHPKCPAAEVIRLRTEGKSFAEIGRAFGVSEFLPSKVFYAMQPNTPRQCQRPNYLTHPKCPAAEVIRLRTEGKTFAEIGNSFDVSAPTAAKVFYAMQPNAPRGHQRTDYLAHPKCPSSEVVRLRAEGKAFAEIGHILGTSAGLVMKVFYAIHPNARGNWRRIDYLNHPKCPAFEVVRYRTEGKTFTEIGRTFGVTRLTVIKVFYTVQPDARRDWRRNDYLNHPTCPAAEVVRMRTEGKTYDEIGRTFSVCGNVVSKVFRAIRPDIRKGTRLRINYLTHPACPVAEVIKRWRDGESFDQIGRELNVSKGVVSMVFHAAQVSNASCDSALTRPALDRKQRLYRRIDYLNHPKCPASEVVRLRMEGSTFEEIGSTFGVSYSTAAKVFHTMQPSTQTKGKRFLNYLVHPKCPASEVKRRWQEGESLAQIGRELNVSTFIASKVFHAVQASHATCGSGLTRPKPDRERRLYCPIDYRVHPKCPASEVVRLRTEGESFAEIGLRFDVSAPTVTKVFYAMQPNAQRRSRKSDYLDYPNCSASEVVRLRAEGKTFAEIGSTFGVSAAIATAVFYAMRPNRQEGRLRINFLNHPRCSASEVVQGWRGGKSFGQIGREMKISRKVVVKVFNAAKASHVSSGTALTRPEPDPSQRPCRLYAKCPTSEVVRLRSEGKTFTEIGRTFGVSYTTAAKVFHATQPTSPRKRKRWVDYLVNPECFASEVVRLRKEGKTFAEIERVLGVSARIVKKVFDAMQRGMQSRSGDD